MTTHILPTHDNLPICIRCGGAEGALSTSCPDRRLDADELDAIYAGKLDFRMASSPWGSMLMQWDGGVPQKIEMNRDDFRIIDIDNCIAPDGWRVPSINWATDDMEKRYRAYHQLSAFDGALQNRWILSPRADRNLFLTARPAFYRPVTEHWLRVQKIDPIHVLMRPDKCQLSAPESKRLLLAGARRIAGRSRIRIAFDDRRDVLAMYRSEGIETHRIFIRDLDTMNDAERKDHE